MAPRSRGHWTSASRHRNRRPDREYARAEFADRHRHHRAGPTFHRVRLDWKAPITGDVFQYRIYREAGDSVEAGPDTEIAISPVAGSIDVSRGHRRTGRAATYTYVVVAVLSDDEGTVTPESNQRTVTVVNDKPQANAQAVVVFEDWPSDPITVTAQDPDTAGLVFSGDFTSTLGTVTGVLPTVTYLSPLELQRT